MKILDKNSSVLKFLLQLKRKKICIVSAFAVGTEEYVDQILENGNTIDMILGTINAFSSPSFIEHHIEKHHVNYNLSVDFRYENSTHWKVYLVEPDVVIVGSSNFTNKGLMMDRDTCIYIENSDLYDDYIKRIQYLSELKHVMCPSDKDFEVEFERYKKRHRRAQNSLSKFATAGSVSSWLDSELNQSVPLFIWDALHNNKTKEIASKLISDISSEESRLAETDVTVELRDFFTSNIEIEDLSYDEGDTVLCMSSHGRCKEFHTFDRIVRSGNVTFMFSFKRGNRKYPRPFYMSEDFKSNLALMAGDLYSRDCKELTRNMIVELDAKG